jgi:hypothetical protein
MLTGHFPEISKRSGVTYLFRRGRPTIALRQDEEVNYALCALCLHPIGYYGDTWAGVMCPTDEVSSGQPINYYWQTNSVNVPGATSSNVTVSALGLVPNNTYTLTLLASNSTGTALSDPVMLTVVSNPPAVA